MNVLSTVHDAIDGTYKVEIVSVISEGAAGTRSSVKSKAAEGTVGKNGIPYTQQIAWISEWEGETIVSNREHLDSALTERFFGSNQDQ
ncbi:hypothetical protein PM082_021482 [Marasmius tenuissimus]|nr:hypothetical protein PM082_021482 [Marasmius tenuissimus]